MFIEMPNPVQACLIIGPSILGWFNYPIAWEGAIGVPISEVVGTLHDDERRDTLAVGIDALDHGNPFPITRLDFFSLPAPVDARHDYRGRDLAYYKAGLVEVIDILVLDAVFRFKIHEKREPARDLFRIFAEGPLVVVYARETRSKFWLSLYEARGPTGTDA